MREHLMILLEKYKNIDIHAMGFHIGWDREPLWQ